MHSQTAVSYRRDSTAAYAGRPACACCSVLRLLSCCSLCVCWGQHSLLSKVQAGAATGLLLQYVCLCLLIMCAAMPAVVPAGSFMQFPTIVSLCPAGQWKGSVGADEGCTSCADGVTTPAAGATSAANCTCERGALAAAGGACLLAARSSMHAMAGSLRWRVSSHQTLNTRQHAAAEQAAAALAGSLTQVCLLTGVVSLQCCGLGTMQQTSAAAAPSHLHGPALRSGCVPAASRHASSISINLKRMQPSANAPGLGPSRHGPWHQEPLTWCNVVSMQLAACCSLPYSPN